MDRHIWTLLKEAAAELVFPRRLCACCGAESPEDILCPDCRAAQSRLRSCRRCASFLPSRYPAELCPACQQKAPPFVLARAALPYEGELRQRLLHLKYNADLGQRRYLAPLLLESYQRSFRGLPIDFLLPVPLSPERYEARGYNHAAILSRMLGEKLGLAHRPELLHRVKNTRPLASLPPRQRQEELQGAFAASAECPGQRILLIDDIFTSGSTATAASQTLLQAGASAVYVLTVAAGWASVNRG